MPAAQMRKISIRTALVRLTCTLFQYAKKWHIEIWHGVIARSRRVNGSANIAIIAAYSFQLTSMGK